MKEHLCKDCGETDPLKFYGAMKGQCLECYKKRYKGYYRRTRRGEVCKCEVCGETDLEKFYPNCKILCKVHYHDKARTAREINLEQYREVLQLQKGCCAICGSTPKSLEVEELDIDGHDGLIRGLLCANCLGFVGRYGETFIVKVLDYLRNPPTRDLEFPLAQDVAENGTTTSINDEEKSWLSQIAKG